MNQLEKIEDRVLSVLESNTQSRSDDMVLYLLVCNSYSNNENPIGKMPFEVVMKHYRELKLPHFESVRRIARRRKDLGLKQTEVCERAGINDKYLSCIERAASIPSLDVVMRLSFALDCTPDEFLVGSVKYDDEQWRDVAGLLRNMNIKKLDLAKSFLLWLNDQEI